jgi:hypothetical protein
VGYSLLADIRARTDESKLANVRFAPIADVLRHCGEPTLRAIETDITRVIKTARVEPARRSQPRCPLAVTGALAGLTSTPIVVAGGIRHIGGNGGDGANRGDQTGRLEVVKLALSNVRFGSKADMTL